MIDPDTSRYTIQAFGLTPDGSAIARVRDAGDAPTAEIGAERPDPLNDPMSPLSMTGRVVLCDGLMPGEIAEVLLDDTGSRMLTARLVRILERSPDRIEPFCPVYGDCGGCTCQTLDDEALLLEKQRHVRDCLLRIARIPEEEIDALLRPILAAEHPTGYRNHMQYQVRSDANGAFRFGLHARKSHETVATPDCAIAHPITDLVKNAIEQYLNEPAGRAVRARIPPDAKLIVRVGTRTGQVLYRLQIPESGGPGTVKSSDRGNTPAFRVVSADSAVGPTRREGIPERRSAPRERSRLVTVADFDARISQTLRALESPFTLKRSEIEEQIGSRRYFISPESFFQVNTDQAERLYDTVLEFFEKANAPSGDSISPESQSGTASLPVVLDLYCGTGSIGLHLSARAHRIIGIESNAQAVEDARRNAQINAIPNAEFHVGLAEDFDYGSLNLGAPLTVVLDPPRKGCSPRLLEKLITLAPDHILYVSCDPATLARDLRILIEKGYRPEAAQPVDIFPWTGHVETVVLMSRVQ